MMWNVKLDACNSVRRIRRGIKYLFCELFKVVLSVTLGGSSSFIASGVKYFPVKLFCIVLNGLESLLKNFSRAAFLASLTSRFWRADSFVRFALMNFMFGEVGSCWRKVLNCL